MSHDPGRLVEDDDIVVFINDWNRQELRFQIGRWFYGWEIDLQTITISDTLRRLAGLTIDEDRAALHQLLYETTTHTGHATGDQLVQSLAMFPFGDLENESDGFA